MDDQQERALCVLGCRSNATGLPFPADNGYLTCDVCAQRLRKVTAEIPGLYEQIMDPDALLHRDSVGGRPPKGYRSAPPASLHLMSLRDPRSTCVEPGDPHSALNVVWWYANHVRELLDVEVPPWRPTVGSEVRTLLFHWDWIMRQVWVAAFARDIREVHTQLERAGGAPVPKRVGTCTRRLGELGEEGGRWTCGEGLYLPTNGGKIITCDACGQVYRPADMINLYVTQRDTP